MSTSAKDGFGSSIFSNYDQGCIYSYFENANLMDKNIF